MSGNIGKVFVTINDSNLRKRVVEEFEDMQAKITSILEEAETIVSDYLDYNHLYLKDIGRIVLINIPERIFENMEIDVKEFNPKIEFRRLHITI